MRIYAAVCLAAGVSWSCQASVKGKVNSSGDAEGEADAFAELDDPEFNGAPVAVKSTAGAAPPSSAAEMPAMLGARPDVFLKSEGKIHCSCVSASLGTAHDSAFGWEARRPTIRPQEQMVVAFASDGQACPDAPPDDPGAAYRGYVKDGKDVVVLLERAGHGKPRVMGAIIPKPEPGGRVLVQPYQQSLPYGKASDGGLRCELLSTAAINTAAPVATNTEKAGALDGDVKPERGFTVVDVRRAEESQPSFEDVAIPEEFKEDHSTSERDSFYLGAMVGGGYSQMTMSEAGADLTFSGINLGFDVYIGGALSPGLALGLALGGSSSPNPELKSDPAIALDDAGNDTITLDSVNLNYFRVGPFVDWYVNEDGNLHLLFEAGYMGTSFTGESVATQSPAAGFGLGLGVGYDWWLGRSLSMGLLGRVSYGILSADEAPDASVNALLPTLYLTLTYH